MVPCRLQRTEILCPRSQNLKGALISPASIAIATANANSTLYWRRRETRDWDHKLLRRMLTDVINHGRSGVIFSYRMSITSCSSWFSSVIIPEAPLVFYIITIISLSFIFSLVIINCCYCWFCCYFHYKKQFALKCNSSTTVPGTSPPLPLFSLPKYSPVS